MRELTLRIFSENLRNEINVCYEACFIQGQKRIESNYLSVRKIALKIKISYFNLSRQLWKTNSSHILLSY